MKIFYSLTRKIICCVAVCMIMQAKAQLDPNLILTLVQVTTTEMNGIASPGIGSLVFNTTENSVFEYNGTTWLEMTTNDGAWKTDGNAGTDDTTDFIGTTDPEDFVLSANGAERLRLSQGNQTVRVNQATQFNNHPFIIRANGDDVMAFQDNTGTTEWHWNLLGNGLNFAESGVADFRIFMEQGGQVGINTSTPDAQLDIESTDVPLRIQPSATTPTGTLGGQMFIDTDGLLYTYDTTRTKWLSMDRNMVGWGRNSGSASNEYLRQFNGSQSNNNGWRMIRDATITAITVQSNNIDTFDIQIRSNDNTAPILTFTVTAAEGDHDNTINIDVSEGDFIQCFLPTVAGGVSNPQVLIEVAWRK
ncbi:type 1 periplasmic-binding domain-containing protein [Spongiivirga citrea]|uniref:Uncharacterized protein n=1 Tax=Spongiivirga citrea TaxID=1481457 RepID=A0A6M0CNT6_9FLAO|nr:hypothetical protein [Spongiivirga citrea]NER18613.1 hypothetical protein [Spongiivirga citrea]